MKTYPKFGRALVGGAVLLLAGFALAQDTSEKTLAVNGKTVRGAILETQGRTYVDIKMLSDAMGATLTIEPNRISLAVPAPAAAVNATQAVQQAPAAASPAYGNLSTNFRTATIAALSEMREWQGAVESVIQFGVPVVGSWPQDYRDRAQSSIDMAKVNAFTESDQNALQLLQNEFDTLRDWSLKVVTERTNLDAARFVDPNALKNDTVLKKITGCSRFLGGMISSGVFSDDPSCH